MADPAGLDAGALRALAPDGLGARLQDEDVAAGGQVLVDRPFDVHRAAVVLLDALAHPGQFGDLVVDQRLHLLPLERHLDRARDLGLRIDRVADQLLRDDAVDDVQRDLVDHEMVRRDLARHHRLAEAEVRIDDDHRAVAVGRVDGEHHAGGVGIGHLLHAHADGQPLVVEALVGAVGDGAPGVQAGDAAAHVLQHLVGAADPQVGVLLAGEARAGQVFGGGAGAHRHRHRRHAAAHRQLAVALGHLVLDLLGERMRLDHRADARTGRLQRVEVVHCRCPCSSACTSRAMPASPMKRR